VALYRDEVAVVKDNVGDNKEARLKAVQVLVEGLKLRAMHEAAEEINHALDQPMDSKEFARSVEKASREYTRYIRDWRIIRQEIDTRGSGERIKLSVYFVIDKVLLRKALVGGRAIIPVARYRTYVELYWNVPDKEISPEVIDIVLENVEDYLAKTGYEVVQFEQIKGKLVKLLRAEKSATGELFSQNELARFKANLDLRNIDQKFVNGKQILADYADLLFGVTINTVEVTKDKMLRVRLTINATLFERGKWVSMATADRSAMIPFVRGSTDNLIVVAKHATQGAISDLEPKVRRKLARRKAIGDVNALAIRDFALVFQQMDRDEFAATTRRLRESDRWKYNGADAQTRTIRLGYAGQIDNLADHVETYLEEAGIYVGAPDYSETNNHIMFNAK